MLTKELNKTSISFDFNTMFRNIKERLKSKKGVRSTVLGVAVETMDSEKFEKPLTKFKDDFLPSSGLERIVSTVENAMRSGLDLGTISEADLIHWILSSDLIQKLLENYYKGVAS